MGMYAVLEPLATDRRYAPGEIVDLSEQDAAWLIEAGVVSKEAVAEGADRPPTAAVMIALAKQAPSLAELDKLAEGETRKTVLDAVEARRRELTA